MSTNMRGMLAANLDQALPIETTAFELRDALWLKNAAGSQLDLLGRVYNTKRQGRTDDQYRQVIQARAAVAVNGTPDEIITFLETTYGTTGIQYIPQYPAAFYLVEPPLSTEQLQSLAPAGVGAFAATYLHTVDGIGITTVEGDPLVTPS